MPVEQKFLPILRWIIANAGQLMGVFSEIEKLRAASNWTDRVAPAQTIIGTVFPLLDSAPLALEKHQLSTEAFHAECTSLMTQADALAIDWGAMLALAELIFDFLRQIFGDQD